MTELQVESSRERGAVASMVRDDEWCPNGGKWLGGDCVFAASRLLPASNTVVCGRLGRLGCSFAVEEVVEGTSDVSN